MVFFISSAFHRRNFYGRKSKLFVIIVVNVKRTSSPLFHLFFVSTASELIRLDFSFHFGWAFGDFFIRMCVIVCVCCMVVGVVLPLQNQNAQIEHHLLALLQGVVVDMVQLFFVNMCSMLRMKFSKLCDSVVCSLAKMECPNVYSFAVYPNAL